MSAHYCEDYCFICNPKLKPEAIEQAEARGLTTGVIMALEECVRKGHLVQQVVDELKPDIEALALRRGGRE